MNSKEVIKIIEADGWQLKNVKGSHHHYRHPSKKGKVTVPHPKKDLPIGTANSILRQAGLK
ncbi:type II toxin-antitoxin system HicA family toxin [Enterococcus sp. BWR-S5]|uniref:type II toxin-antitoxin system HicA family toxin n=1 Tax=Enterococcus sp. BWR-S5 TaxID=2787714 RepID=UPI001921B616|nr:type II toxin-antitoxin system HicA family toxin [Enterococcus sp. BWR-S5]MBL1225382.1 type II toxin-antitoxin system HicA family toxin [Enterococcus sp. BWR-S5]